VRDDVARGSLEVVLREYERRVIPIHALYTRDKASLPKVRVSSSSSRSVWLGADRAGYVARFATQPMQTEKLAETDVVVLARGESRFVAIYPKPSSFRSLIENRSSR
jgi:hypothetical protein